MPDVGSKMRTRRCGMKNNRTAVYVAAAMIGVVSSARAAVSDPVFVDAAYEDDRHWMTVFTNEVPLTWAWNTNASQAKLEIAGMNSAVTTNFLSETESFLWRVSDAPAPADEDVYDVTLTFYADGETVVGAMTSRLAVVVGAFGETAVNADTDSPAWGRVKGNAVIPYDAAWYADATNAVNTRLVIEKISGPVQTNAFYGVSGFAGWKLRNSAWGYGTFGLSLAFPGTAVERSVELTRLMDGTAVSVR
jgi:hypothetical protein